MKSLDDLFEDEVEEEPEPETHEPYELWRNTIAILRRQRFKWSGEASCIGVEMFSSKMSEQRLAAESLCPRCPVQFDCLYLALVGHEDYGVWGGTTEEDRVSMFSKLGNYKERWTLEAEVIIKTTAQDFVKASRHAKTITAT